MGEKKLIDKITTNKLFRNPYFWIGWIVAGLIIKLALFPVRTGDFIFFLEPWINFIKTHGYASSLKYDFYNYTPTYIYILIIIAKTGFNPLFSVKIVSVLFEFLTAYFVGKILRLKYRNTLVIWISMAIIPWLPTVILNSSYLSQCDSIYSSFVIGSIYYLLKNKQLKSVLFLGIAFLFKMQAIFILPVFFVAMLQNKIRWYYFLIIPSLFLLSLLPAYFYGRPFTDLLGIYLAQSSHYQFLTMNFPNIYIWINNNYYETVKIIGMAFTFILTLVSGIMLRKYRFTYEMWILFALISSVLVPFILPGMHERYMYLGDILSVLYLMVFQKNRFVPAGILSVSLYSYIRCSRYVEYLPMEPAFFIYLAVIVFLITRFVAMMMCDKNINQTDYLKASG